MKLTDIKGVGEKVARELIAYYGSEEAAVDSLQNLEFERLFSIPTIPAQKLTHIAKDVYAKKYGFKYANILKTQEAREIYSEILETLRECASTDYGRLKLSLFYPTKDRDELKRRFQYAEKARNFVELNKNEIKKIKEILKNLRPLSEKPKKMQIPVSVVTENRQIYEKLKQYADVFLLESIEDLRYLKDREIRYIQTKDSKYAAQISTLPNAEILTEKIEECVPEVILNFFIENKQQILAGFELLKILKDSTLSEDILKKVELLDENWVKNEADEKLKKFSFALKNIRNAVNQCVEAANNAIAERIEKEAVPLEGKDVLKILSSRDIYENLPRGLLSILKSAAEEWEEECARKLGMEDEKIMFSGLFSIKYPIAASEERLQEIESWLNSEAAKAMFKIKQKFAHALSKHIPEIKKIVAQMLELDVLVAIGDFFTAYKATTPKISSKLGIHFRGGRHLLLEKKLAEGMKIQPVDYAVGDSGAQNERVVVLTGANSGGKTTLLETVAQIQIMAQCGLPVLAEEACVPLLEGVYFYRKYHTSDAGTFETLLKSFAEIKPNTKLILADEIEATTEPGAAAKIITALLEWFEKDKNTLVLLVTHLGEDIKAYKIPGMRIDGIEAEGLDENLNLIVNRNPVLNKVAKSTPELIVERLSKAEKMHANFYKYILERFKTKE